MLRSCRSFSVVFKACLINWVFDNLEKLPCKVYDVTIFYNNTPHNGLYQHHYLRNLTYSFVFIQRCYVLMTIHHKHILNEAFSNTPRSIIRRLSGIALKRNRQFAILATGPDDLFERKSQGRILFLLFWPANLQFKFAPSYTNKNTKLINSRRHHRPEISN